MQISYHKTILEIPDKVRQFVLDRDAHCCQNERCQNKYFNLTLHHIVERGRGGSGTNPCNLITLCWNCHMQVAKLKHVYPDLIAQSEKDLVHRYAAEFYDHEFKPFYIKCSHYEQLTGKKTETQEKITDQSAEGRKEGSVVEASIGP